MESFVSYIVSGKRLKTQSIVTVLVNYTAWGSIAQKEIFPYNAKRQVTTK